MLFLSPIPQAEYQNLERKGIKHEQVSAPSTIFLERLDLAMSPLQVVDVFSHREGSRFSLLRLQTLCCTHREFLDRPGIRDARQSLQALQIEPPTPEGPVRWKLDMADFPNVSVIGLRPNFFLLPSALTSFMRFFKDVFRPTQKNTVRVFVFPSLLFPSLDWPEADAVIDELLSTMSPPPMIALDRDDHYRDISPFFVKLSSSGRLRQADFTKAEEALLAR
ncbi:unnamed protein product [Mycena citricolor]|uniref:Uncharacterized protein n=1 Tax=Mycena citricolor TaxID=2018698 RepID=A0AAD2H9Y1_9AGAR|nr:unnamed protein product [Mycena citricolor]